MFFPPKKLDTIIIKSLSTLKPDILALVEVDTGSFISKKDEVKYFKEKLNMNCSVQKVKYSYIGWSKLFHKLPVLRKQANAIISKYKLKK